MDAQGAHRRPLQQQLPSDPNVKYERRVSATRWLPPGGMITADRQILRVSPLVAPEDQDVGGFRVWFFGFEFCLLTAQIMPGASTIFDKAMYRPAGIRAVGSNTQIAFDWISGPQSPDVVLQ